MFPGLDLYEVWKLYVVLKADADTDADADVHGWTNSRQAQGMSMTEYIVHLLRRSAGRHAYMHTCIHTTLPRRDAKTTTIAIGSLGVYRYILVGVESRAYHFEKMVDTLLVCAEYETKGIKITHG